jgi:hypothetical protein
MGLSISHGAFRAPYSAFMRWRVTLAKEEGIPLKLMEGFYLGEADIVDYPKLIKETLENSGFTKFLASTFQELYCDHLPLKWSSFKPSPLHELLYHSDCDGSIPWESLKGISYRLEYILENYEVTDSDREWGDRGFPAITQQFIDGAKKAYEAKEDLTFG